MSEHYMSNLRQKSFNFQIFGLTRPGIEPGPPRHRANALTTRLPRWFSYPYLLTFWKSLEGDFPHSNYKRREILHLLFCSNISSFSKAMYLLVQKKQIPTRHDFKIDKISLFQLQITRICKQIV